MSTGSLAKTSTEYWQWVWRQYQNENPGPFRPEDLVDWALEKKLIDLPDVDPKKDLLRKARQAARASRIKDLQGRTVREMLPAKVPLKVDEKGNILLFEVRYDHIHTMSADHALLSFDQRDENITKQRRSATRDLESFLDNNPNAIGHEEQFQFDFTYEDSEQQAVETVEESPQSPTKPR